MFKLTKRFPLLPFVLRNVLSKPCLQYSLFHFRQFSSNSQNHHKIEDMFPNNNSAEKAENHDSVRRSLDQNDQEEQDNDNALVEESKLAGEIDPLSICIQGLETYTRDRDILKFCTNDFNPPIQLSGLAKKKGASYAFLTFPTVEERMRFEAEAADKKLKNKKLKIRPAALKNTEHSSQMLAKLLQPKEKRPPKVEDIETEMAITLQQRLSPLWQTPYEEQIKLKEAKMKNVLKSISLNAIRVLKKESIEPEAFPNWLRENSGGPCCKLSGFIGADSDKTFHYRNKAEFTIGKSYLEEGKTKVGFNIGNFRKGFMFVEDSEGCPVVSKESLELSKIIEKVIQDSEIPAYEKLEHQGFWRYCIVRQSEITNEILINIVVSKEAVDEARYQQVKEQIVNALIQNFKNNKYKIVSILLQDYNGMSDSVPQDGPVEVLYGDKDFYMNEIMGYKFRVNTHAFLQVHSSQCHKLYNIVKEVAGIDQDTVFLDICSGIGTIGICTASNAKKIVGIEMVEKAVKDAEYNSSINGLSNTEYHVAKVENAIEDIIKPYVGSNKIVAVVDPPRAGLHKHVIKALRMSKGLDKIIYISCNPEGSLVENVLGLCLPENKKRRAPPFTVTVAYGVDLFPQTNHFEAVLVLERLYNKGENVDTVN